VKVLGVVKAVPLRDRTSKLTVPSALEVSLREIDIVFHTQSTVVSVSQEIAPPATSSHSSSVAHNVTTKSSAT
jgi:hypothetical protein